MNTTGGGPTDTAPIHLRWGPAQSYPDPAVQPLEPRFDGIEPPMDSGLDRLATGFRWAEGPVWFGDGRYLLWSDIPNNRILKWEEETGAISVFRKPSNNANGNTRDRQGGAGAPADRRARCAARHANRIRRDDHRDRGALRGQAAELAQRHRVQVGRLG